MYQPVEQRAGQALGAEFIDDQELVAGQLLLQAKQPLLVPGFQELMDQSGSRSKTDRQAPLAGGEAETVRDVGLARTGVAERDQVLLPRNVLAGAAGRRTAFGCTPGSRQYLSGSRLALLTLES